MTGKNIDQGPCKDSPLINIRAGLFLEVAVVLRNVAMTLLIYTLSVFHFLTLFSLSLRVTSRWTALCFGGLGGCALPFLLSNRSRVVVTSASTEHSVWESPWTKSQRKKEWDSERGREENNLPQSDRRTGLLSSAGAVKAALKEIKRRAHFPRGRHTWPATAAWGHTPPAAPRLYCTESRTFSF